MKQKITIEVQVRCEKCRAKAMKIAVPEEGVISVALKGENRDKMEIIGDGVDAVCLAKSLRKKLGHADLLSVEEIMEKKPTEKTTKQEKKTENENSPTPPQWPKNCRHHHELELHIYDPPTSDTCTIL